MDNYDLEFPLKGSITKDDIKKIQEKLLEIALFIRDCLDKNQINYTIMFGSLLGAIRHNGFIPWDLDFDIGVCEDDYDKAMECIANDLPDDYVVQNSDTDSNYCAFWSKVTYKKSVMHFTMFANDNNFDYKGLHVDVYKLKSTNADNYEYDLLNDNKVYFDLKYKKGLLEELAYEDKVKEIQDKLDSCQHTGKENDCYYFLNLMKTEKTTIFPLKKYMFEGYEFNGPADSDKMLRDSYYSGDYMIPPKYEDRDIKIDGIEWL